MSNSSLRHDSHSEAGIALSRGISKIGWSRATVGIASAMLIPSSADAQTAPAPATDDLPQVRVTAPKRQAAKRQARPAPARTAPAIATGPTDTTINTIVGDGAGIAGYSTPAQAGISRFPAPLLNTPQTVNVVTQQLMQDQRTTSIQDALRNVPGITFTAGEGGVQGDQINIRGFSARNDIYRDGIRDPGWYARDSFSFDRVEVYKGPSSFLFGRGSTGGVINIVSKLPQNRDFYVVEANGLSSPGGRVTTDFNKTFGDVTARLAMVGYDTDIAGRDFVHIKRFGFAPSVAWQMTDQTKNTLSYVYQNDDNIADRGIPMLPGSFFGTSFRQPAPVPRNTYYGLLTPGQNDIEQTQAHSLINKFEHEFDPGLKLTNTTGLSDVARFNRTRPVQINATNLFNGAGVQYGPANPITPATPLSDIFIANTNHFQNQTDNMLLTNVTDLNAKFRTGFLDHNVLMGMEWSTENRRQDRTVFNDPYRINVANPNPFAVGTLSTTTAAVVSSADARGFYVQDQMKVTEWLELLGGVRHDTFMASADTFSYNRLTGGPVTPPVTPTSLNANNDFLSYRAGVVLHPTANSSVYYMRGTSANPPAEFTTITNGQQSLDPVTSLVDEVGVKADLLNNKLNVNAAVFRIKKSNDYENRGTAGAPDFVAVGDTQVEGFEVGATGKLTDAWSVSGGYAFLESRVLASLISPQNVGRELAFTPKNSFSVFSTYDVTRKITVGGGAFYVDSRFINAANDGRIPGYVRFDAVASYKVDRNLTMQLNVYNIADTYYFDSAAGAGYAIPGTGRYVSVSARASF